MTSTKKKRVSKKTKASWRKHTDIKDVEDFLEEQRAEERIGTFSEKKDEDLFQIDVSSSAKPKKKFLTEKQKRKANALKPLRTFAALENTSKVQDPIVKRNHVKQKKNGRNIEQEILQPKTNKQIQANKDRSKFYDKLEKKLSKNKVDREFSQDIWQEEDVRDREPGLKDDTWVSKDLALYTLRNIGKGSTKIHDSIRHKTTKAKKFEPPHPGTSYNPSLKAHQDLINTVVSKEADIIKVEKHLKRVTTDMFSKVTLEEREQLRVKELSTGSPELEGEQPENVEDAADEKPYKPINLPVENKKKSKQARRKQKEQKVLSNELRKKKELKKQAADIHRIKKLKIEVEEEAEQLNQLKKHRKLVEKKKKSEPKRLGRLKFKEPDVDIEMPNELAGNLRNVKVQSSLLVDRFKNFQKRNILPTSVDVGKRKPRKIKRFTRNTHKEPGVSIFKNKNKK
ncbi:ribosome biogenesis protein NOP53 [Episyrphus balteatus]|uniref:ribosome biogenesis protein NOP53 n=1 Tax=Episyrphus balteatus TaxID=286459 RepID=UPI0024864BEE|nr:ribosome biogenesis protein NOP53 [Episyrphus balteatus]